MAKSPTSGSSRRRILVKRLQWTAPAVLSEDILQDLVRRETELARLFSAHAAAPVTHRVIRAVLMATSWN